MKRPLNQFSKLILCFGIIAFSSQAYAECELPTAPIVPDGNVASTDELVAAQGALKAFQADLVEYRNCLAKKQEALAASSGEDEESAVAQQEAKALVEAYNNSVTKEEEAANEFNAAVRAYKARQE